MPEIMTTEIVAYNEFRAQLAELKEYNDKAVFDYMTPKGNKDARSHVHKLRKTKAAVDTCRKAEKKASLEYGRKVDGEAKEIIFEIEEMIYVHQAPILEIENREKQRVAKILDLIEEMRGAAENTESMSAYQLTRRLASVKDAAVNEEIYQEFTEQAVGAKAMTLDTLAGLIKQEEKREDDQAELDRLRKESEARAQKDRDERIAKEAAECARKEAEQAARQLRINEEIAIQGMKDAEIRAANAAKEAEKRLFREAEEKKKAEDAARAKREANKKHLAKINSEAIAALVDSALLTQEKAKLVVMLIKENQIPNVSIKY